MDSAIISVFAVGPEHSLDWNEIMRDDNDDDHDNDSKPRILSLFSFSSLEQQHHPQQHLQPHQQQQPTPPKNSQLHFSVPRGCSIGKFLSTPEQPSINPCSRGIRPVIRRGINGFCLRHIEGKQ